MIDYILAILILGFTFYQIKKFLNEEDKYR
jgi:hypothetical protein